MVEVRAKAFFEEEAWKAPEVGTVVTYHGQRWHAHVALAFPLGRHYEAVFS